MADHHALLIVALLIILFICLPLIPHFIRKRDFNRQINGKKPERTLKGNEQLPYDSKEHVGKVSERDNIENSRRSWMN